MGEFEERLKTIESGKAPQSPKLKSDIEKALDEADTQDAKDILRAQTRRRVAEEEARAREAEARLRQSGGTPMTEEQREEAERQKAEQELREKTERIAQAKALYTSCIEAGGDPKRCADMVAGLIPSPATTAAAPPATSVTELIHALTELDQLRGDRGGELKEVLEKLTTKVEALGNRPPADPIAMAQQQAQAISSTYEALKTLGIIKEPEVRTEGGESLDVVRERNRHEERMADIKTERDYKEKLGETVANLPEEIGRGMASRFTEEAGGGGGSSSEGVSYLECEDCHSKIYVTPGTKQITCPKCHAIYTAEETAESKTE